MPLARHDGNGLNADIWQKVSTHMPLARHDKMSFWTMAASGVSTHMPLARHDKIYVELIKDSKGFYSHASCEA